MDLSVVPIHQKPEYLLECCRLINEEWKRSETARLRSLDNSCNYLPVNLILLKEKVVIGHVKLSKIPSMKDCCFIESVVIKSDLRGKGYGSYLMNQVEDYCIKTLHLKVIYLSTKGQENFYQKLGYTQCEPIQLYGTPLININRSNNFKPLEKALPPLVVPNSTFPPSSTKTYMVKNICTKLNNKDLL